MYAQEKPCDAIISIRVTAMAISLVFLSNTNLRAAEIGDELPDNVFRVLAVEQLTPVEAQVPGGCLETMLETG